MTEILPIKVLAIVNRGEAAMRCIRAVKSLGALEQSDIKVVALYTHVDRDAPFVRHADIAIELPVKTTPVAAYLDYDLLIETLRAVNADAVWPGWGFVAEHPAFVDRLKQENIRFLGPSPESMRALGDKITSKIVAERSQVPVTKWSQGVVENSTDALEHAKEIGLPLVIKATAGGGGRGIRVVRKAEDIASLFESAASEAVNAFGDGRLFMEAMVQGGRHIEVQIVADQHGTVIPLGTRDCSVQRRHQKVLEEAPPVGLPEDMLEAIKQSAASVAREVGYYGVGTVEFLVKAPEFFFLEMNPRLQVEHGITEELTGVDLVQWQIRIARGERLPTDGRWTERGYALEARVCAEDPDQGFLPAPGKITRFDPALGPRLRLDTGVNAGATVPAAFDSLIAKVISYGDTREEAIARLKTALRDFDLVIEGGATNKGYILELLDAPEYVAGGVDTLWLDRWNEKRVKNLNFAAEGLCLAAILSYQANREASRTNFYMDSGNITPDKIPASAGQEIDITYGGTPYRLHVFAVGAWSYRIHMDGCVVSARLNVSTEHAARLRISGQDLRVLYDVSDANIRTEIEGLVHSYGRQTAGQIRAGAPSMVVSIAVEEGQRVEAGQALGILEAMKMEIGFDAPIAGVVKEIRVRKGQQVAAGDCMIVIDAAEESAEAAAARLALPKETDPLACFFSLTETGSLGAPSWENAQGASAQELTAASHAVNDELRRIILGYDAHAGRVGRLISFLEMPLPQPATPELLSALAHARSALVIFADVEELFSRQNTYGGDLEATNNAMLRVFVRRLKADGAGVPESFLTLLRRALVHYRNGAESLETTDGLERAILRLFSSQLDPSLRFRLMTALARRVLDLANMGVSFSADADLRDALQRLARLRVQLSDNLADSVVETFYAVYQRPELDREADKTTARLSAWLAENEKSATFPPAAVLGDLAHAPPGRFLKVIGWLVGEEPLRRRIGLAAGIRRMYATHSISDASSFERAGFSFERATVEDGTKVLACVAHLSQAKAAIDELLAEAKNGADALELIVVSQDKILGPATCDEVRALLPNDIVAPRLTITSLCPQLPAYHRTYVPDGEGLKKREFFGIHPAVAARIGLQRYTSFDLKRISASEDIYCFHGTAKNQPDDERIFVLVDVRSRSADEGSYAELYLPVFERAFFEASRTLRSYLAQKDPRRRLQWNRLCIFLSHPVVLGQELVSELAQKLYPATRHLGLERVSVRLRRIEPGSSKAQDLEVIISDPSGNRMDLSWRAPHISALVPVTNYERNVVAAKRRGLIYPYEIIRMLTQENAASGGELRRRELLPSGQFEEYDIGADGAAYSVKDRVPGANSSSVVFGLITTPTEKIPEGMRRVIILSDPTRHMGALSGPECDRVVAAIDLAESLKLPVEWIPVSSGARIAMDSGTENLDATARVVRRIVTFTQTGGVIHLIVSGINVGAQSYWDALSTMLLHTRGILVMTPKASMVLTGRAALAASGSVSAESEVAIGGYERIMAPNGQGQYSANDLNEAFAILYQHYEYTYVVPGEARPRRAVNGGDTKSRDVMSALYSAEGFEKIGDIFDQEKNPGRKKPFSMRQLMAAVIDENGGHLERWKSMVGAETAIVWDAYLGDEPVTLIGIESQNVPRWGYRPLDGPAEWNGGTLFPSSSKKVARALNAASGNRPAVILANLSGFDGSPESMRKLQLEYGAEIARAVVNFDGPIIFLVVSRYHGGAYVVFSQELNPNLRSAAIEGSYASVIGGGPAATVVFPREVRARVEADERVKAQREASGPRPTTEQRDRLEKLLSDVTIEKQSELAAEFDGVHSVQRAQGVGSLSDIIRADELRSYLCEQLGERVSR